LNATAGRSGDESPKECTGNIDSYERNSIGVQFLQSLDPASASSFALGGVDYLPSLVVSLLDSIAGF